MNFYTYMLQCADQTFYIGSTNDVEKRLHAHNYLKSGAKYTKMRRPVRLVYTEHFATFHQARVRENELKKLKRKQKEKIISNSFISEQSQS